VTTLYNFCPSNQCGDGISPLAGLVQASDGNFYGTTDAGGPNNPDGGIIFRYIPGANGAIGDLTTIYSFCDQDHYHCLDGQEPEGGLIQASDGDLYGTTATGGEYGHGTLFKINPATEILTTLYSFNDADGEEPMGDLVQGTDGNIYGTTNEGGTHVYGTVFRYSPATNRVTTLHNFDLADGYGPTGGLVQYSNGDFYGTTSGGGAFGFGTVFKISPTGTFRFTLVYSFCLLGCLDGAEPVAGLVLANDGNFYGTTWHGGQNSYGTVFKMSPGGMLQTLASFCPAPYTCGDGKWPGAPLFQDTNGTIYGTTSEGGTNDGGTVFSLGLGKPLHTTVDFDPVSGKVGAAIRILGQGFTKHTKVSFNGTPAAVSSYSSTYLKTTVPAGATTGYVTVVTTATTLQSNSQFRVTPQIVSFTPASGPVGTHVIITGVSLKQTTNVTFGDVTAAVFSAGSNSRVTATVPKGAVIGKIAIATEGGTAASAESFVVTK
jgi:uncharacterized repeat protein (TIGR03803 family)